MSRKRSGPSKSILSEALDQRLKMYSLAAAATGVSMLAFGRPAHAEVVVAPKNLTVAAGAPVYIEMTGEGRADFELVADDSVPGTLLEIVPLPEGEVLGNATLHGDFLASRLSPGAVVGPLAPFGGGGAVLAAANTYPKLTWISSGTGGVWGTVISVIPFGFWASNTSTAYLGVKFPVAGHTHYGWIRLEATILYPLPVTAKITAYGYETEPDTPILVPPVPADDTDNNTKQDDQNNGKASVGGPSLGMLALGAHGLALWRH
jgi:hypothetical protein